MIGLNIFLLCSSSAAEAESPSVACGGKIATLFIHKLTTTFCDYRFLTAQSESKVTMIMAAQRDKEVVFVRRGKMNSESVKRWNQEQPITQDKLMNERELLHLLSHCLSEE